mgnify:CR=1 FL=1
MNRGTYVAGCFLWVVGMIMLASVALFALNSLGTIGTTIVEREVFERSFQYDQARESEILTYKAQLEEIKERLNSGSLTEEQREALESQRAAIRVRLKVAEGRSR